MSKLGIDVSRWQGDIDWSKVKAAGVEFVIIKAGGSDDGTYQDSRFESNYSGAKAADIPVGAYYFVGSKCTSKEDGIADAKRFIDILAGKQFEYPVYIDFEAPDGSNKNGNTEACIGFCKTMEAAGYYVGIYASDISGFKDRLNIADLADYDMWVARYGSEPKYVESYGMWQFTSEHSVSGISGNVDGDYAYKDYPTIIKNAGLNGFSSSAPTPEKDTVSQIVAEIDALKEKIVEILKS